MFKKIVEFFTGKKPESKYAHPLDAVTTPAVPQAPYKLEPPAATTPIPYVPAPPLVKLGPEPTPEAVPAKKKRTFAKKSAAPKKPAAIKATPKPRTKKTP